MIAVDTNVLVYAHREDSPWHSQAVACVTELAESTRPWAIPWPCIHEFYSIVTHLRIYKPPTPFDAAIAQIEAWLESPTLSILSEGPSHWEFLKNLLLTSKTAGPVVHDARIAALCLQHGVEELWSADRDFSWFSPLVVKNPLIVDQRLGA